MQPCPQHTRPAQAGVSAREPLDANEARAGVRWVRRAQLPGRPGEPLQDSASSAVFLLVRGACPFL